MWCVRWCAWPAREMMMVPAASSGREGHCQCARAPLVFEPLGCYFRQRARGAAAVARRSSVAQPCGAWQPASGGGCPRRTRRPSRLVQLGMRLSSHCNSASTHCVRLAAASRDSSRAARRKARIGNQCIRSCDRRAVVSAGIACRRMLQPAIYAEQLLRQGPPKLL